MAIVLIVVEGQPDGKLRKASLNALTAGAQLAKLTGSELHAVALGKDAAALAEQVKAFGPKVVHAGSGAPLDHYPAETYAPAVPDLARPLSASYVGVAAPAVGRDLLPRVAARLQAAMATDVMAFSGGAGDVVYTRPMWAGAVIAEVKLSTP